MNRNFKTSLVLILALLMITLTNASSVLAGAALQLPQPEDIGLPPPAACQSLGAAGTAYVAGVNCRLVLVDGYPRAYIVYVPPTGVGDPAPVVFMFHGGSGTGAKHFKISGWREKADKEGLVAVFPTGLTYCKQNFPCESGGQLGWTTRWHDYGLDTDPEINLNVILPDYPVNSPWPADDVRFTRTMIDDLNAGLNIDPDRIYATGFSNGAAFTARLAIELSDLLAAVGYVAGGLVENAPQPPAEYIPVYAAIGTDDPKALAHITSQPGLAALPLDPADLFDIPEVSEGFITPHLESFDHTYDPDTFVPYFSYRAQTYTLFQWQSDSAGGPQRIFRLAVLGGLEHTYPTCDDSGPKPNNPECFQATDQFWPFFEQHPKSS